MSDDICTEGQDWLSLVAGLVIAAGLCAIWWLS